MKKHQYPPEQYKIEAKVEEDIQNLPTCGVFGGADALVLMTAHREFRELDLRRAKERMRTPTIIDGRRVFDQSHEPPKAALWGLASTYREAIRVVWESRTVRFRSRRVQHFGWTILKQAEGVRGLGLCIEGGRALAFDLR